MNTWKIIVSESCAAWFEKQTERDKAVILSKIYLLEEYGPNLGRPHADTIKGGRFPNLKELRAKTGNRVFRIAYIFDPERNCLLLTGGDKKGKDQEKFYTDLINDAERIYAAYLKQKKEG